MFKLYLKERKYKNLLIVGTKYKKNLLEPNTSLL